MVAKGVSQLPLDKLSLLAIISKMGNQPTSLGAFLKAAREGRSLTLRGVEQETGVSNAYLSQIESGKIRQPSPAVLHKLAELYGVPYAELLSRAGYPVPETGDEARPTQMVQSRLGPITAEEEKSLKEYLAFLRSRRPKQ
jgi:transcriptional regulator with XRE-family HTH domain